jgi:hypothetical protein
MSNAFAPIAGLDPIPSWTDLFIRGLPPIDYSPILLRIPFGFQIATDTCPPKPVERRLQVRSGCVRVSPSYPLRLSIPSSPFG